MRIAVEPAARMQTLARLLDALSRAFDVEFVAASPTSRSDCDGLIHFGAAPRGADSVPTLRVIDAAGEAQPDEESITFDNGLEVPNALRGRTLRETALPAARLEVEDPTPTVLATVRGKPIWACDRAARLHVTSIAPVELGPDTTLRSRLRSGSFMALLPLVEFLRDVVEDSAWDDPPQHACFVFDDPNLHASRYGYIRYDALRRHAAQANYHVAMAMVPLDAWYAAPSAVRIFRTHPHLLSLTVHGINHVARELDRGDSADRVRCDLAQALRRVARFERRYGIPVARVMIAPHGTCSTVALDQLLALGFDGVSLEWPYWWLDGREDVLAGWEPADLSLGGTPIFPRHHLASASDDLVLRAYLRQPLVVYGHHGDLAGGLDVLETPAGLINSFDRTEWCSLGRIAETNYRIRRIDDDCAVVRCFSARARVAIPAGTTRLVLDTPRAGPRGAVRWLVDDGRRVVAAGAGDEVTVRSRSPVMVSLASLGSIDYRSLGTPRLGPWSVSRRVLVEGRDRLAPRVASIANRR